jgi:hypothetical protein
MASEPFLVAYFINPSDQCPYVYLPIVARQRLVKPLPAVKYAHNNRGIIGRVVFYAVCVLSTESLWVCLCIPPIIARQRLGKHVPAQRRIIRVVVSYAVHVVSKRSM